LHSKVRSLAECPTTLGGIACGGTDQDDDSLCQDLRQVDNIDENGQYRQSQQNDHDPDSHEADRAAGGLVGASRKRPATVESKAHRECYDSGQYRGKEIRYTAGNSERKDAQVQAILGSANDREADELTEVGRVLTASHDYTKNAILAVTELSGEAVGGYDADFFDRLAAIEDMSFWFRARNRLIVQLASEITSPGDQLLEVGCGTGYVLRALVRECGLSATGSELFAEGLEYARRRVPEARFVQLDAREMPYEQSLDIVGAFDVLEHIDDDVEVLRGFHRAVRPGGFLLLTVPQHPWLWSAADTQACHVRRYRRADLVERLRQADWTPVRITSFVTLLLPLMALSRWRERFSRRDYDAVADLVPPVPVNWLFERILDLERVLIKRGVSLPIGGSLVIVARREDD
jgi:SAM-dependent methyltransferase